MNGGASSGQAAHWQELLRHQSFVRRLARGLVRDGSLAEDLEQEAWRRALEQPPREAGAVRAWFGTVLRRLAGRQARDAERRQRREHAVARPETVTGGAAMGERLRLEELLVQAVAALREPYREAIYLRYFEERTPRAISAHQGVPVATVKTRLRRGLELLREALDRHEDRRIWMAGLLRLVPPRAWLVPALATAGAGLVLTGVVVLANQGTRGPTELVAAVAPLEPRPVPVPATLRPAAPPESERDAPREESPREAPRAEGPQRERSDRPPRGEEEDEKAAAPAGFRVTGRVLFPDRGPVAGAALAFGDARTTADDAGRFDLVLVSDPGAADPEPNRDTALVAWTEGWVPAVREGFGQEVHRLLGRRPGIDEIELVLPERALTISGTLLERDGGPAEGWKMALVDGTLVHRGRYRPITAEELCSGVTGHLKISGGHFSFGGLAPGRDYRVRAWNPKTLEQVTSPPLPAGSGGVVLRASNEPLRPRVDGVVLGMDGQPIPDVRCRLSMDEYRLDSGAWMTSAQETRTDGTGRFEFHDVPRSSIFIRFNIDGVGAERALDPAEDGRDLVMRLVRSGGFRVETTANANLRVLLLDENDERLRVQIALGPGRTRSQSVVELAADGSCEGVVSENARWLVLQEGERERARLPVVIRHGETALVRW